MSPETGFLDAILKEPNEPDHRLVYADWLEETGDLRRAEFLRLDVQLIRLPPGDERRPGTLARLRELLPEIGAEWLALLDRTPILNCRDQADCPGRWERLGLTVKARVRECAVCRYFVHHARTEEEALEHDRAGRRLAIDSRVETPFLPSQVEMIDLPGLGTLPTDPVELAELARRVRDQVRLKGGGSPRGRRRRRE